MANELYKKLGTSQDYSLLAGTGTETQIGVALAPGNNIIERGTVIQKDENGLFKPAKTGEMANGDCAVLIADTDTGAESEGVAGSAAAFKTGRFLSSVLKLADGELSAEDLLELRRQGILTDGMSGEVNNEVSP